MSPRGASVQIDCKDLHVYIRRIKCLLEEQVFKLTVKIYMYTLEGSTIVKIYTLKGSYIFYMSKRSD